MEKRIEFGLLLDCYMPLLTERQKETARLYAMEDMTAQEIALETGVTRQAVHESIRGIEAQLMKYESQLGLVARFSALRARVDECIALLDEADSPSGALEKAKDILRNLDWTEEVTAHGV